MAKKTPTSLLLALVVALLVAMVAGGIYVGRLRWQNALLRADLAHLRSRISRTAEPEAETRAAADERVLSSEQRRAMLTELDGETGPTKDVWFTWVANNREAAAYQRALQGVFEEAGWHVRSNVVADFPLRPGIFFLMADDAPPSYVLTALAAFNSAGIEVSSGRGYRAFHDERKQNNPNWRGFDMAPSQTYIVAIGRMPTE